MRRQTDIVLRDMGFIVLLVLLVLLLYGIERANQAEVAALNSWLGMTEQQLYFEWGPPDEVHPDGAGGKIVVYRKTLSFTTPGRATTTYSYGQAVTTYAPPKTTTLTSYRMFWIDSRGVIYRWQLKGL